MPPLSTLLSALLLMIAVSPGLHAEETVRLQLKWRHQFQFAGYYAAKEKGYYRQAGLNVELIEAAPDTDSTKVVSQGDAEYGVGNSGILLSRNAGKPLVVLAVILQHSPFALLTQKNSDIRNIHDLAGKRLMVEPLADEIFAYLHHEGVPIRNLGAIFRRHNVDKFISGEVDAISAYITDEPYLLEKEGIDFNIYMPQSAGIDFYGDNLFTTERELEEHPERVKKFREASLRGWRYAMNHQEEIIDLILSKYPTQKNREFLAYEARQMQRLMHPELIDVGYMLEGRWRHIAQTYASLGMLPADIDLEGFLYRENPRQDYFWFYAGFAITLFVLTLALSVNIRFSQLNKQLARLLNVKSQFANIGESVNNIAHQWKQPLNELGIQLMRIEQLLVDATLPKDCLAEIKKLIGKGHDLLEFMANTVDAFGHVLGTGKKSTEFAPKAVIEEVLYVVRDSFALHNIKINYLPRDEVTLHGNPSEFSHAVLSILNNARDIFLQRHIEEARITIDSYSGTSRFHLDISDNAGGILTIPVEQIFSLGYSDKKSVDSGVGLFIARKIVEENFHGSISARNNAEGAVFQITMPCR